MIFDHCGTLIYQNWPFFMARCLMNNSLHLAPKYARIFVICSEKRAVFRKCNSRKTVNYKEQIMLKDKQVNIFLRHMEAIVFTILQFFLQNVQFGEYLVK